MLNVRPQYSHLCNFTSGAGGLTCVIVDVTGAMTTGTSCTDAVQSGAETSVTGSETIITGSEFVVDAITGVVVEDV